MHLAGREQKTDVFRLNPLSGQAGFAHLIQVSRMVVTIG
jgi:hypothetical protein